MQGLQEMGPLFPGIAERFTTLQAYALAQLDGAVDFKGTIIKSTVQDQTRFFRKFGFRVNYRKEYPYYVDMKRFSELSIAC